MTASAPVQPAAQPPARAGWIHLSTVSLIWFGNICADTTSNFIMPHTIRHYTSNAVLISYILLLNPLFGVLAQPWGGYFSDGLRSRWGRRRPVLLVSVICLLLSSVAIPHMSVLWALVIPIVVYQFTVDVNTILQRSMIGDTVPASQRGQAFGFSEFLGRIAYYFVLAYGSLIVAGGEWRWYYLVGFLMLACIIPSFFLVTEPDVPVARREPFRVGRYFHDLVRVPHFLHMCLIIAATFVSYNLLTNYYALYTAENLGIPQEVSNRAFRLYPLMGFLCWPIGWLCDRVDKKYIIGSGIVCVMIAALIGTQARVWWEFKPGEMWDLQAMAVFGGIGVGSIEVAIASFLVSLMPPDRIGQFSGLANVFRGGPRVLMFLFFGPVIEALNRQYIIAYYGSILFAIIALILVCRFPKDAELRSQERAPGAA